MIEAVKSIWILLTFTWSSISFATHPYYAGIKPTSGEFRAQLNSILNSVHIPHNGKPDEIASRCPANTPDCYQRLMFDYKEARRFLFGDLDLLQTNNGYAIKSVYCNEIYNESQFPPNGKPGPGKIPSVEMLNAEHTWPQSKFTTKYPREMQKTDVHILFATDKISNVQRSNLEFADVDVVEYDTCKASRKGSAMRNRNTYFEPPDYHKGNVARAIFYFAVRYKMKVDPIQEKNLRDWHQLDPVDNAERARHERIFEFQKDRNPFIDNPEWVNEIQDF